MLIHLLLFFLGVALAPVVRPMMRPLLVEATKVGLHLIGEIRRLAAETAEGIEDAVAEAEASQSSARRRTFDVEASKSMETKTPP